MLRTKQTVETPKDRMALVHDAGMGKVSGVSVVSGTLVAYGAFLVEFIRRSSEVLAGLTAAQLESLALCAAGLAWLVAMARRGGLERLRASGVAQAH